MPIQRQVYLLDPHDHSPETIAVTFAKTSRSPESFREIAAGLTDSASADFNEKWVVGYGHASVAEHAVLHIAVENLSRLAVETLESNRLASYTEKSTRYQKWGPEDFFIPPELEGHPRLPQYIQTCRLLFQTYQRALDAVRGVVTAENPRQDNENPAAWERRLRPQIVDVCRFLLPAASLANVGVTINARALEHAIQKMLSHPLAEVRGLGLEIKQTAQSEVPTLVKYAQAVPYLEETSHSLALAAQQLPPPAAPSADWCQLVNYDPEGEEKVLAAALYRFAGEGYAQAQAFIRQAAPAERLRLAHILLSGLDQHDIPLRELEHTSYTFDLLLDQGAYFEVKRHRIMTQTPQALTARLGYTVPRLITAAGIQPEYQRALETARQTYEDLAVELPDAAAYVVPNAFNRRLLLTMNLRTAFHFCSLRASPNAHFSARRVAQRMAEQIRAVHPTLAAFMRLPENETWQQIEAQHFTQV